MASVYANVLSENELEYLKNQPEVVAARASLDTRTSGMVYFSVVINEPIQATLRDRFGLNVAVGAPIPMRWIKGDVSPHVDVGASAFENTFLLYLNDSPGELIVDAQSYPIEANTAFMFNEGLCHETRATGAVPRLLLGPMNELSQPVGSPIIYYNTLADALSYTNAIGTSDYTIGNYYVYEGSPITSWRIASKSGGSFDPNAVYTTGMTLDSTDYAGYAMYPAVPCFLEGTTVLCEVGGIETYVPVEELKKGSMVKTCLNGLKPVVLVGKGTLQNPGNDERIENRLYKCASSNYPELKEDLFITGCHSILEFPITAEQKEASMNKLGKMYVTDKKYRIMACVDERAEPWNSEGAYPIWHFALEHPDERMNYGVYVNGGLLVETCSIQFLKTKSNMALF
jgi:hypothetical protein